MMVVMMFITGQNTPHGLVEKVCRRVTFHSSALATSQVGSLR